MLLKFQGKAKKEEKDTGGPRLNDKIKADFVRLVSDDGMWDKQYWIFVNIIVWDFQVEMFS